MVAKDIWKRNWGGGNMEWKCYKIDELIDEISMGPFGSDVKKEFYVKKGVPILNGSNLQGFKLQEDSFGYLTEEKAKTLKKCIAQKGDIIVTHRGTLGQIVYVPKNSKYDKYVISQSQFRFRCKKDLVDVPYLVYYFHTREGQHKILANASQVGVPALARATSTFRRIEICLPPLAIQRRIASILSSLDRKIELNNKINADLEEMAQAIFKNWFVDFEPFKDGKFVDSELGMIPEGWKVGRLTEIASYMNGLAMQKFPPENNEDSLPVLKIKELGQGFCGPDSDRCSCNIKDECKIHNGDVIFSWSGTLLVDVWCGGDCGLNQHLFKVTSKEYPKWFYYYWTKHHLQEFIHIAKDKAVTMGHIKRGHLEEAMVAIPDNDSMEKAHELFEPILSKMISLRLESSRLSLLRDTLLPRLMSGELEIPE